jgi:ribosome maturation factor RimP
MIKKETIAALIENYLKDNSLFLVDINISLDNDVEVTVESYFSDVSFRQLHRHTKIITDKLNRDVEDFSLTVTSAGLDQPFRILPQYLKYLGKEVSVN